MKLDVKIELLKLSFALVNTIFLVLGLSVGGCAVWILFGTGSFLNVLSSDELQVVMAGLLMVGGVVLVVGVAGCVAMTRETRLLLLAYLGFLIVLLLGQLYITLLLLMNRHKIEDSLNETVDGVIFYYGQDDEIGDQILDSVQHHCCGRTDPADWLNNSFIQSLNLTGLDVLPCSCFNITNRSVNSPWCSENSSFPEPQFGRGQEAFNQGCSQKLEAWLQENLLTIVGMDVGLILIQVANISIVVNSYQMFGRRSALRRRNRLVEQAPDEDLYEDPDEDPGYVGPEGRHPYLRDMNHWDQNRP
ncbi:CD82 antigen isoform X2 [Cololabis saira]|uniref:CD82 antigen isoform X2 n=1 Tax=Cololabis saira TaxID=129043 RepID=UPI002AD54202|nr:CD82 antigen isoform X2 [Cololabis saira]